MTDTTTETRSRPILFSGEMVRAILDGRKTQTRRVVKPQPANGCEYVINGAGTMAIHRGVVPRPVLVPLAKPKHEHVHCLPCPYGQPGDELWVREAWRPLYLGYDYCDVEYRADAPTRIERACFGERSREQAHLFGEKSGWGMSWCTPIHMPRWASRLTLRITDVRVERVQDISHDDAELEGVDMHDSMTYAGEVTQVYSCAGFTGNSPRDVFAQIWDSINAARGHGWDANDWVWALTLERINNDH